MHAAHVTDRDENDPPDQMAADRVADVLHASASSLRIHDIQGAQHRSPYEGDSVTRVPGIVTALQEQRLLLAGPRARTADESTSEGIFVFTSSAPTVAVGDSVLVSGRVTEFRPGGAADDNLTTTELSFPIVDRRGTTPRSRRR